MREGFHAHSGWYFRRDGNGNVTIEVAESDRLDAPLSVGAVFDPDTWASIVASVSKPGESAGTWNAARRTHMGDDTRFVAAQVRPIDDDEIRAVQSGAP